eukprot:scaffold1130_cov195-Pinguiococcus_pyrenoidosus.AAC.18
MALCATSTTLKAESADPFPGSCWLSGGAPASQLVSGGMLYTARLAPISRVARDILGGAKRHCWPAPLRC